jgi:hypothetical protein
MICSSGNSILTHNSDHGQHWSSYHPPSRQSIAQTSQCARQTRFSNRASLLPTKNRIRGVVKPSNVRYRIIKGHSQHEEQLEANHKIKRQGGPSQHPQEHRQRLRPRVSSRCTQGRGFRRKNPWRTHHHRGDQGVGESGTSRKGQ